LQWCAACGMIDYCSFAQGFTVVEFQLLDGGIVFFIV
jgi:hypothetical protein